jgi:hypothetical protein
MEVHLCLTVTALVGLFSLQATKASDFLQGVGKIILHLNCSTLNVIIRYKKLANNQIKKNGWVGKRDSKVIISRGEKCFQIFSKSDNNLSINFLSVNETMK